LLCRQTALQYNAVVNQDLYTSIQCWWWHHQHLLQQMIVLHITKQCVEADNAARCMLTSLLSKNHAIHIGHVTMQTREKTAGLQAATGLNSI
jgi:hypothetical protein